MLAATTARIVSRSLQLNIILVLIVVTLPACEATPHPLGGLVKAGIVMLAGKVPQSSSFFAEHWVLISPTSFLYCNKLPHAVHRIPWYPLFYLIDSLVAIMAPLAFTPLGSLSHLTFQDVCLTGSWLGFTSGWRSFATTGEFDMQPDHETPSV